MDEKLKSCIFKVKKVPFVISLCKFTLGEQKSGLWERGKIRQKSQKLGGATHLSTDAMHLPGATHMAQVLQRNLNGRYAQKVHYAPGHWCDASIVGASKTILSPSSASKCTNNLLESKYTLSSGLARDYFTYGGDLNIEKIKPSCY